MDTGLAIINMFQQIPNQTLTDLYSTDEHEGTHCCLTCRREMLRVYVPFIRKYVMPSACQCVTERLDREEEERVRKLRRAQLEKTYKRSLMNERLRAASFENFILRKGTELCYTEAMNFAKEFESRREGLMLFGSPGNGKSHLLAAVHHSLDRRGYVSLFLDVSQLFGLAKGTYRQGSKMSLNDIISAAIDADLLTLDELGSGELSEHEFNDILFPIINGREGKPTNYTTNLDLERLSAWFATNRKGEVMDTDGRLIDRILGSTLIVKNHGSSKRQEDAMNRMNA